MGSAGFRRSLRSRGLIDTASIILITLAVLSQISQGSAMYATADFAVSAVVSLIAAAAAVLLFTRQSWLYYRPEIAGW
jgi:uncharacterized membrane protein (DUF441 family)